MSAQRPPPRWRSARHNPHKGAGLGGPFCAGGFCNADQLSGHLPFTTRSSLRPAVFKTGACSSTGRLRHGFIISPVPQKRPDSAGHLRRKGDNSDVGMGAHKQRTQPGAYCCIRLRQCWHGRSRALDQHLAQVSTAALCDPEQLRLPSVHRTIANHSD